MSPTQRVLVYYFWLAPHSLQILILLQLFRRSLHRKFPIFTIYTVFGVASCFVLLAVSLSVAQASYFKWCSLVLGLDTLLCFGLICELFSRGFSSHRSINRLLKPVVRYTTILCFGAALLFGLYTNRSAADLPWFTTYVFQRSANIILCGLMLVWFLSISYFQISLSKFTHGVALGFGLSCTVNLAITALQTQVGSSWRVLLEIVDMASYHVSVVIWLYYLVLPERKPLPQDDKLPETDLHHWNAELEHLLQQ